MFDKILTISVVVSLLFLSLVVKGSGDSEGEPVQSIRNGQPGLSNETPASSSRANKPGIVKKLSNMSGLIKRGDRKGKQVKPLRVVDDEEDPPEERSKFSKWLQQKKDEMDYAYLRWKDS